jgi:hypothetical protein
VENLHGGGQCRLAVARLKQVQARHDGAKRAKVQYEALISQTSIWRTPIHSAGTILALYQKESSVTDPKPAAGAMAKRPLWGQGGSAEFPRDGSCCVDLGAICPSAGTGWCMGLSRCRGGGRATLVTCVLPTGLQVSAITGKGGWITWESSPPSSSASNRCGPPAITRSLAPPWSSSASSSMTFNPVCGFTKCVTGSPRYVWNHQCRLILDVRAHRPLKHGRLLATILSGHAEIRRVFKLSL